MTLWSTPDRTRYFLIPEGRELPPGGLLLVRLTGQRQEVDPAAAAEFEVARDEAKSWTESELKAVLGDVRGRIQGALDDIRRKFEEKAAAPESQEARRSASETLEGLAAALERAGSAAGEKLRAVAEEMRREAVRDQDDAAAARQGGDDDDRN